MFTRYATAENADIIDIKGSHRGRIYTASLDKMSEYQDFRTDDDYLYVRIRAISSRVNQNYDGWPTVELAGSPEILSRHHSADGFTVESAAGNPEFGFATFLHKPIFVDHNNGDPKKTRGIIVDAKFHVLGKEEARLDPYWSSRDVDPRHLPASEIELLLEIDAKSYPKFANAIKMGHLDGFSMGCNVQRSICSHCGNVATSSGEFCVPGDTYISMADGTFKFIKDVVEGDKVITHNGIGTVDHLYRRHYRGPIYNVDRLGSTYTLTLTPNHEILTYDANGEFIWKRADRVSSADLIISHTLQDIRHEILDVTTLNPEHLVKEGDRVVYKSIYQFTGINRPQGERHGRAKVSSEQVADIIRLRQEGRTYAQLSDKFGISKSQVSRIANQQQWINAEIEPVMASQVAKNTLPCEISNDNLDLMTVAGYYLAEGSLENPLTSGLYGDVVWTFHNKETHYMGRLKKALRSLGAGNVREYSEGNRTTMKVANTPLATLLGVLCGRGSRTKSIHPFIALAPHHAQQAFFDCWNDGDGATNGSNARTASDVLAHQMSAMGSRLYGYLPEISKRANIGGPTNRDKMTTINLVSTGPRKILRHQIISPGVYASSIKDIRVTDYDGLVYNFSVDDQHSYVANGITVHNCSHINMKGIEHDFKTSSGERVRRRSYENVEGVQFFEISGVFVPADETALTKSIIASQKESVFYDDQGERVPDPLRGDDEDNTEGLFEGPLYQNENTLPPRILSDEGFEHIPYRVDPGFNGERTRDKDGELPIAPMSPPVDRNGLPVGSLPPVRSRPPGGIYNQEEHGGPAVIPNQAVMNDPRWSHNIHTAENELPQSMKVHAPDSIDTLREEHICPICGAQMDGDTCDVCFPPGTLIRTAKGLQPIETIEVGDLVLSADGVLRPVAEVMVRQYTGNLKQIDTPSLLEPILATPNHPFAVLVGEHGPQKTDPCKQSRCTRFAKWEDNHRFEWQHAGCLTTDHYVVSNHLDNVIVDIDSIEIPEQYRGTTARKGSTNFALDPNFLWAIGQYLAEGSSGDRSINFASHRKETAYQSRLIKYFESQGFGTKLVHREDKSNSAWVNVYSSTLAEWLPDWLGKGCDTKYIPAELMNLPIEKLAHVYEGYLSGDGCKNWNNAKTTSPILALQIAEIGRRLGARPSIQTEHIINKRTAYTVNNVYLEPSKRRFTQKNVKNTWVVNNHLLYKITSVKDVPYSGPVYNLSVIGHPSYTVQNLLVHNCGYVQPPKQFDNPDLNKAKQIHKQMKEIEEAQSLPQNTPNDPNSQPESMPNKSQTTASVNNRMNWAPLVSEKTAAKINKVEKPVLQPNTGVTNQPSNQVILSDQMTPVTSAMLTAKRLMATVQRNNQGENMSNIKVADGGPKPPEGTAADKRVNVVEVGGVMDASNEAASAANTKQVDLMDIGGTGDENVEPDSVEELPTADPKSGDAGYNTDITTDNSGPTKTFGDSDGNERAFTDPVTRIPFPSSEEGVKAAHTYYAMVKQAQDTYAQLRQAYDNSTLEKNEQQGDDPASTDKHVKGVEPSDPVGKAQERINPATPATTTKNNSGPTVTWSGTGGNGVLRQQDPVTPQLPESGQVPVPDFGSHTGSVRISSLKLAELEVELGLTDKDQKYNRIAALDKEDESIVLAQIETLSKVRTAGLSKLAQSRTAGATKVPRFARIASETAPAAPVVGDFELDSALFFGK